MSDDQNNENANSQNGTADDQIVIDDTLDSEAKVAALTEQNKKLFERAKKAEGFTKQADGTWKKKEKPPENKPETTTITNQGGAQETPTAKELLKSEEFKLFREGYDEQDIELIMNNGGRKILESKDHPITIGIAAKRKQKEAERAASAVSDTAGLSEVERKYTPEQLRAMPAKELEKILPHANQQ